jgi:hypothetical protein
LNFFSYNLLNSTKRFNFATAKTGDSPRLMQATAKIAQLVERDLAKVEVAGPSPVFRSSSLNRGFSLNDNCENSSVGRARPCQGRGRGSESRFSLEFF